MITVRIIKSSQNRVYLIKCVDSGRIIHKVLGQTEAIRLVDEEGYILNPDYQVKTLTAYSDYYK